MSKNSEAVKYWRRRFKSKICSLFGNKCNVCGYSKCQEALEFHHLDPNEKDFNFGNIRANPKNLRNIIDELKKCIMVCANCHREIHYGHISVDNRMYLNENMLDENGLYSSEVCVCGNVKFGSSSYCSKSCAAKFSYNHSERRLASEEIEKIIEIRIRKGYSFSKIGKIFGVSDSCVSRKFNQCATFEQKQEYKKLYDSTNGGVGGGQPKSMMPKITSDSLYRGMDLKDAIKTKTNVQIGLELNVSEAAVRRARKVRGL